MADDSDKIEISMSFAGMAEALKGLSDVQKQIVEVSKTTDATATAQEQAGKKVVDAINKEVKAVDDLGKTVKKTTDEKQKAVESDAEWMARHGAKVIDTTVREEKAVQDLGKAVKQTSDEVRKIDFSALNKYLASGSFQAAPPKGPSKPPRLPIGTGGIQDISAESEDAAAKIIGAETKVVAAYKTTGQELRLLGGLARIFGASRVSSELEAINVIQRSTGQLGLFGAASSSASALVTALGGATAVVAGSIVVAFAAVAAGAAAVVVKLTEWGKATAELILKHEDQAEQLRVTTAVYGQLLHAGDSVGISQTKLVAGLKSLSEWMARTGRDGEPLEKVLAEQADRLNAIEDPAQRAREAFLLFGEAGQQMALLTAKGGAGIDALRSAAEVAFNDDAVEKARAYRIAVEALGEQWTKFKTKLGEGVFPVLTKLLELLAKVTEKVGEMTQSLAQSPWARAAVGALAGPTGAFVNGAVGAVGPVGTGVPAASGSGGGSRAGQIPTQTDKTTAGLPFDRNEAALALERKMQELSIDQDKFEYDQKLTNLDDYLAQRRAHAEVAYGEDIKAAQLKYEREKQFGNVQKAELDQRNAEAEAFAKRKLELQKIEHDGVVENAKLDKDAATEDRSAMEENLRLKLTAIEEERAANEAAFAKTAEEKHLKDLELLQKELDLLNDQVDALEEKATLSDNEDVANVYEGGVRGAQGQQRGVKTALSRGRAEADPNSVADQMVKTIATLRDKMGTAAQNIAQLFSGVVQSAVDGVAASMEGLIKGTMTWGQALRNIGGSIINSVITGISKMFAQMIVGMVLSNTVAATGSAQRKANTAGEIPGQVTLAGATSVSSYGGAAVAGLAALLAVMAVVAAFAGGGKFARGGRPPVGRPSLIGEQGPELWVPDSSGFIVPADRTARMMNGDSPSNNSAGNASSSPRSSRQPRQTLVLVDDRIQARDHISSAPGNVQVRQIVRGMLQEVGILT